jgi:hypothetical protein
MPARQKTPKEAVKVRRLPIKGETLQLSAEVTRVAKPQGSHEGLVTLRIAGYPSPITIPASLLSDRE